MPNVPITKGSPGHIQDSLSSERVATRFFVGQDEYVLFEWPNTGSPALSGLTKAKTEVASLIVQGLCNAEIAKRRQTSIRTTANQVASVFRKLGVASRAELVAQSRPTRNGAK